MANKERNAFLARAMGECWHEFDANLRYSGVIWPCKHCGDEYLSNERAGANRAYNFSSWAGFGKLWTWAQEQTWWYKFFRGVMMRLHVGDYTEYEYFDIKMIDPDKFADGLYKFLKE